LATAALSCAKSPEAQPSGEAQGAKNESADLHDQFAKVTVEEVEQRVTAKEAVAVDANGEETRKELGTLPGALLLTNSRTYDVSELPNDKGTELIFYCGSEKCMSAPRAAERAKEAGYSDVKVMPAGIRGWVKAGKPVERS